MRGNEWKLVKKKEGKRSRINLIHFLFFFLYFVWFDLKWIKKILIKVVVHLCTSLIVFEIQSIHFRSRYLNIDAKNDWEAQFHALFKSFFFVKHFDIKLEMISFVPSWNTDQGVYHCGEYWGDENLQCAMKVMMRKGTALSAARLSGCTFHRFWRESRARSLVLFLDRFEWHPQCWDPKEDDLYLNCLKSVETLMEG